MAEEKSGYWQSDHQCRHWEKKPQKKTKGKI